MPLETHLSITSMILGGAFDQLQLFYRSSTLTGLLVGTAVRVTASFNPSIAVPVTLVITSAAFSIFAFYMKTQRDVFVPLEEKSFGGTLVALFGLVLLLAAATSAGLLNPSNVTPQLADVATIKGG